MSAHASEKVNLSKYIEMRDGRANIRGHRLPVSFVAKDCSERQRTMILANHPEMACLSPQPQKDKGSVIEILEEFAQLYNPIRGAGQVFWYR
ncbi:MAG: hypothetical protein IAE89_01340 [Anaerolineae bacterium]|nr:hypothetical protein [Anaerolineae bacterium]